MSKRKSFVRVFTESGPLIALAVAIVLLIGIVGPASAQFFNFGNFGGPPRPQPRGEAAGLDAATFVTSPKWTGSVVFKAGTAPALGFIVGYDPMPANDNHGGVWGA